MIDAARDRTISSPAAAERDAAELTAERDAASANAAGAATILPATDREARVAAARALREDALAAGSGAGAASRPHPLRPDAALTRGEPSDLAGPARVAPAAWPRLAAVEMGASRMAAPVAAPLPPLVADVRTMAAPRRQGRTMATGLATGAAKGVAVGVAVGAVSGYLGGGAMRTLGLPAISTAASVPVADGAMAAARGDRAMNARGHGRVRRGARMAGDAVADIPFTDTSLAKTGGPRRNGRAPRARPCAPRREGVGSAARPAAGAAGGRGAAPPPRGRPVSV
jgi:hypothetical protein